MVAAAASAASDQQQHYKHSHSVLARRYLDAKAKPPGSLGVLEDWAVQ